MPERPPNILFLIAEDTGCHHGCYGDPVARTPAIDGLAAEGCRYDQCHAVYPVCAPSRCSYVTGRYPFELGTHHMRSWIFAQPTTVPELLREHGYFVNWWGKQDFNFTPSAGFSDEDRDWIDDLAHARLPDRPWLLYANLGITHESSISATRWYKEVAPELTPEERQDPDAVPVPAYLPDRAAIRIDIARYYDSLRVQDRQVARILAALERSGQAEHTLVVYLADHGRGLPREKRWCYDAGCHVPLIVRWPGRIAAGSSSDALVSGIDIAPSLLAAAGAPVPTAMRGRPVFIPSEAPQREHCLVARDRMGEAYDRVRGLRSRDFLYLRNDHPELPYAQQIAYMDRIPSVIVMRELHAAGCLQGSEALWLSAHKPAEELYDCRRDPDQVHNLAEDPAHRQQLERMRTALDAELATTDDLSLQSERDLIDQGVICDHLSKFLAMGSALPEQWRLDAHRTTVVERPHPPDP